MMSRRLLRPRAIPPSGLKLGRKLITTPAAHASSSRPLVQDIVHDSLQPPSPRSGILSPRIRTSNKQEAKELPLALELSDHKDVALRMSTALRDLQQPIASSSTSTQPGPSIKPAAARTELIIRMIGLNRILSAMTAFATDLNNPKRKPFTSKEMEAFMLALRLQCKLHQTKRPSSMASVHEPATELWRPYRLDPSIDVKTLTIPQQCMYAMAVVFDACVERKIVITARMTSAMLATFVNHMRPQHLLPAADAALKGMLSGTSVDSLNRINHRMLSSLILIFGTAGKPDLARDLLTMWAQARHNPASKRIDESSSEIDLHGWGKNVVLWNSLVQSHLNANDLDGARTWLDKYRHASKDAIEWAPELTTQPYLTYLAGLQLSMQADENQGNRIRLSTEVRKTVRQMMQDGVTADDALLAFVIEFETTKSANAWKGADLLRRIGDQVLSSSQVSLQLIRALLKLRTTIAKRQAESTSDNNDLSALMTSRQIQSLPSTRSILRTLVRAGEGEVLTPKCDAAHLRGRRTLNEALQTAMSERDYPAAIVILNLFEKWRIRPSYVTYTIVLESVIQQGHRDALVFDLPSTECSDPKAIVEDVLRSNVLDATGEKADLLRSALRASAASNGGEPDIISVTSTPSTTGMHRVQYLVRILNKACHAEIESNTSVAQSWPVETDNRVRPAVALTKAIIVSAQNQLLGPKKDSPVGITRPHSKLPPLLSPSSIITPRRRGIQARTKPEVARSLHSSTVFGSLAPSEGSCNLAEAASRDGGELEPVRVQYLPAFVPYSLGLALQEHLVKQRAEARAALRAMADTSSSSVGTLSGYTVIEPNATEAELQKTASQDTLLLLQHRPVYTEGRREENENEMVANHLRSLGSDYHLTKRGGQITYHGPGQLVGYPILNLGSMNLASRCYVDRIQDTLISMLAEQGIETVEPPENHTGVWADEYHKIASIGIQVRHRISSHGFALNVEKRAMQGFKHIVACGIHGRSMTCIADRLSPTAASSGSKSMTVQDSAALVTDHFSKVFKRRVRPANEEEFQFSFIPENATQLKEGLGIDIHEDEKVVSAIKVDGRDVVVPVA